MFAQKIRQVEIRQKRQKTTKIKLVDTIAGIRLQVDTIAGKICRQKVGRISELR